MRMFNSKKLGNRDCKLIPTTISITNAGFVPGWHHRRSSHHISFPPTSLLVLASTHRHTNPNINRDTHLKPTEDFTAHRTQSKLNLLTQLHSSPCSSPSCQYVFRVATELPKTSSLAASPTPAHLLLDNHMMDPMQHSMSNHLDHQVPYAMQLLSLLLHCIITTGGGVL